MKNKKKTCILIDFDNRIDVSFDNIKELYDSLVYSAAKNGFKIVARDGLSGKNRLLGLYAIDILKKKTQT